MCIDTGISCSSCEILVFSIGDVLMCASVPVFLGQTKVYHIHKVAFFAKSHEKVIRFDISMNEVLRVDVFNAADLRIDKKT